MGFLDRFKKTKTTLNDKKPNWQDFVSLLGKADKEIRKFEQNLSEKEIRAAKIIATGSQRHPILTALANLVPVLLPPLGLAINSKITTIDTFAAAKDMYSDLIDIQNKGEAHYNEISKNLLHITEKLDTLDRAARQETLKELIEIFKKNTTDAKKSIVILDNKMGQILQGQKKHSEDLNRVEGKIDDVNSNLEDLKENSNKNNFTQTITQNSGSTIKPIIHTGSGTIINGNIIIPQDDTKDSTSIPIRQSLIGKTKNFVGREILLDKIGKLFKESNRPISIIGEAGLGKTQLAYEVIKRLQSDFSNVLLFDFTKFNEYKKFLTDFASYLDLPQQKFEELDIGHKRGVILDTLSKLKNVLIYADNFETLTNIMKQNNKNGDDVRLIRQLFESTSNNTVVLLTSRIRGNLDGERIVELDGLSKEEGREMFVKLAHNYFSSEPSENTKNILEQISEKTGGHPLSIELLARSYKGNGISELKDMLEHLGTEIQNVKEPNKKLRSLQACFGITISLLEEDHAEFLPKLTIFSSYFTPQGAQEILGINHNMLQEFYEHGLIRRIDFDKENPMEFRLYYFHLATKNYLQKQMDISLVEQKVKKDFVSYYKDLAVFTYKSLSSSNRVPSIGMFKLMMNSENDFEKAVLLDNSKSSFIYNQIGLVVKNLGDYSTALNYLKQALAIDEKNKDEVSMSIRYSNIGQILKAKGDLDGALEYTEKALAIAVKNKDEVSMSIRYSNIGQILQDMQKNSDAQKYFDKASEIKNRLGK